MDHIGIGEKMGRHRRHAIGSWLLEPIAYMLRQTGDAGMDDRGGGRQRGLSVQRTKAGGADAGVNLAAAAWIEADAIEPQVDGQADRVHVGGPTALQE